MMGVIKKSLKRRAVAPVSPDSDDPHESHIFIHEDEGSDEEDKPPPSKAVDLTSRRGTLVLKKGSLDCNISVIR